MEYIGQILWNILGKYYVIYLQNYGNYLEKLLDIFAKLWDILGKNYRIYWARTIRYIMGYSWQKL